MNLIYGINPVTEALKARGRALEWVGVTKERHDLRLQRIVEDCRKQGVAVRFLTRQEIERMTHDHGHQGVLAVTSAKPSALLPELPTVASAGLPGFECDSFIGAFAPAKVSPAIINLLSKEMAVAVNRPEVKQRFASMGIETIGSSPQVLTATVKSEMARLGKLIKDLGLQED